MSGPGFSGSPIQTVNKTSESNTETDYTDTDSLEYDGIYEDNGAKFFRMPHSFIPYFNQIPLLIGEDKALSEGIAEMKKMLKDQQKQIEQIQAQNQDHANLTSQLLSQQHKLLVAYKEQNIKFVDTGDVIDDTKILTGNGKTKTLCLLERTYNTK